MEKRDYRRDRHHRHDRFDHRPCHTGRGEDRDQDLQFRRQDRRPAHRRRRGVETRLHHQRQRRHHPDHPPTQQRDHPRHRPTRYTVAVGLVRGPTQAAAGSGAYETAAAGVPGVGSNAANPSGFGAVNGYIGGLADTISTLTHLGARDLDPVLGVFTSPDSVLKPDEAKNFSPYTYGEADAINNADPSGLMILGPALTDGDGGWYSHGSIDSRWEDSHPFNDYFLPWKPVADQRSYVPVVPAYQPTRPPYNPITGDPVLGHRGLNDRTPLPDHYWEDQVTFAGIAVDIATLGSATLELAAAATARAAARGAVTALEREAAARPKKVHVE